MRVPKDYTHIWQHLYAARDSLPQPLNEEGQLASIGAFEDSRQYNSVRRALFILECLAEINHCPPEFFHEIEIAKQNIEADPSIAGFSVSPLVDHPKNRHIPHKPALSFLSENDKRIIKECLHIAAYGDFFPDWEYTALFGYEREDFVALIEQWPNVDDVNKKNAGMISNAMGHLLGYPHGRMAEWSNHISVPPEEVLAVMRRWRKLKDWDSDSSEPGYVSSFV